MVGELANAFNIGKNMSAAQVTDCALMILSEYPQLKIDDVALCFAKAKKSAYGDVYDRLDSAVVFKWLDRFLADKDEQIEYYWQHQQRQIKLTTDQKLIEIPKGTDDETAIKYIREIKKDVSKIQQKNREAKRFTSIPVEIKPIQWLHNRWMDQFKKINEDQFFTGLIPTGSRFILWRDRYKGMRDEKLNGTRIPIDLVEFLQYKQNQFNRYQQKINARWVI